MTTVQHNVINQVWDFIQNIPSRKGAMAIAGGAIADTFFGKDFTDIDVFVSKTELERLERFCGYYGFEPIHVPEQFKEVSDSYGNMRRVRIGKQESDIQAVYKGKWLDYTLDFVVVNDENIATHVTTRFDQSIKTCWFDGQFHYSDMFMETVTTGEIFPVRFEVSGYVRAWLSANKYDLKVSSQYNLSKHYMAYAHKNDHELDKLLSEATINKMEGFEEEMFNFTPERANVILMDVFLNHQRDNEELYRKLCLIADQDVVTRHPLHGKEFSIEFTADGSHDFIRHISTMYGQCNRDWNTHGEAEQEALQALAYLQLIQPDQYIAGKMRDEQDRETRIGKYINKIQRKHKDVYERYNIMHMFAEALKMIETRSTQQKSKVFFTGSKHALTHISTKTKWSSCQRWGGFGQSLGTNYGLLANVSGTTLVAYVADERCDKKSSKWHARILVRIGQDGSVLLERVYTDRGEFHKQDMLRVRVQEALKEMGYTAIVTPEEAMDFRSLPMWTTPYPDCSDIVKPVVIDGMHVLRGLRKEIEERKRMEAYQKMMLEFAKQQEFEFFMTGKYTREAIIELPAEFKKETKWMMKRCYGAIYVHEMHGGNQADQKWINNSYQVREIDGVYVLVAREDLNYNLREEDRIRRLMDNWAWEERRNNGVAAPRWQPMVARNPHAVVQARAGLRLQNVADIQDVPFAQANGYHADPFAPQVVMAVAPGADDDGDLPF